MNKYTYLAKNNKGELEKGVVEARSRDAASDSLNKGNLTPISIKESSGLTIFEYLNKFIPVSSTEKVMFSEQLSTLISAGVPISQSLNILEEQASSKKFKRAISDLNRDVKDGLALSNAMENHQDIFSPLFVNMVRSGEVGGILDKTLEEMADELGKEHDLIASIRGAMTYPIIILIAMIGVVIYMLSTIVPQIAGIFTEMGAQLPATTRFLLAISYGIKNYWLLIITAGVGFVIGFRFALKKNQKFRYFLHAIILKIPVFGNLASKINVTRFSRTLGSLLSSGVTMLEALDVTANTIQNEVYKSDIKATAEKVKNGTPLAEALKKTKSFPKIIPEMLAIGEETGSLDKILGKVTEFYQKEVDANIKNLSSLVEPLLMIVIGAGVGFIVISVISPIYSLSNIL